MATYLVTGGAGFIGSHIVDELVRRHERVRVLDNLSTGYIANLSRVNGEIEFIHGDVRDLVTVKKAMDGTDFVLHQAAIPSVPRSVDDPLTTNDVNVTGTLNVLLAARDAGVKRLVFASSSSVYGNSPSLPKREDMPSCPLSPYAVSKLAGERYCLAFHQVYGFPTVCLRYFNVFGPRQDPVSQYSAVIPRFITALLRGRSPTIFGDGQQSRDFTFVADVVAANLLACERETAVGFALNIACGTRHSLNDLCRDLSEIIGSKCSPVYAADRPGDVKHSMAAIDEAMARLAYSPVVSWQEGLRRTMQWYQQNSSTQMPVAG